VVAPREFENSEDAHYYEKEGRNNRGKQKEQIVYRRFR
jgi:hypothetical protein